MAIIRDIMPAFELFQPATTDDALGLTARYGSDAWVLAGGLDSFDWLKDRIKRPKYVVDLSQIKGTAAAFVRPKAGGLEIGAMTTLTEVVRDPTVREKFGLLGRRCRARRVPADPQSGNHRRQRVAGCALLVLPRRAGSAIGRRQHLLRRYSHRHQPASTPFWARTAAWPSILRIRRRLSSRSTRKMVIRGPKGERVVDAEDYFIGPCDRHHAHERAAAGRNCSRRSAVPGTWAGTQFYFEKIRDRQCGTSRW